MGDAPGGTRVYGQADSCEGVDGQAAVCARAVMSDSGPRSTLPRALVGMLADIERRSRDSARDLKDADLPQNLWQGLVFNVAGVRLVSAMGDVAELLPVPETLTRVPGTRDWLLGVANARGNLLTIVDMQAYLGAKPVVAAKANRVLVVRRGALTSGLLVPSVVGMRNFDVGHRLSNARLEGSIGAYVYDAFQIGREIWPVFNMRALAADPRFKSAAL